MPQGGRSEGQAPHVSAQLIPSRCAPHSSSVRFSIALTVPAGLVSFHPALPLFIFSYAILPLLLFVTSGVTTGGKQGRVLSALMQ